MESMVDLMLQIGFFLSYRRDSFVDTGVWGKKYGGTSFPNLYRLFLLVKYIAGNGNFAMGE